MKNRILNIFYAFINTILHMQTINVRLDFLVLGTNLKLIYELSIACLLNKESVFTLYSYCLLCTNVLVSYKGLIHILELGAKILFSTEQHYYSCKFILFFQRPYRIIKGVYEY